MERAQRTERRQSARRQVQHERLLTTLVEDPHTSRRHVDCVATAAVEHPSALDEADDVRAAQQRCVNYACVATLKPGARVERWYCSPVCCRQHAGWYERVHAAWVRVRART